MLKKFKDLTEKEILAIAIAAGRSGGFTGSSRCAGEEYPPAQMFENVGRRWAPRPSVRCSGSGSGITIPLIRRENVRVFAAETGGLAVRRWA
jgi:hypothetical protein